MENEKTPGQLAYEDYRINERGGVAEDGSVMISWDDMDAEQRAVWEAKAVPPQQG